MDREWLAAQLAEGRSIESIAREAGKSPSTVGYWVNKHGLSSTHAEPHAPRGGIERARLETLVEEGLSIRQIATRCDVSATTVRHWLQRHGLRTQPARYARGDAQRPDSLLRECVKHGWGPFVRVGAAGTYRCARCNTEAVTERRRRVKEILVAEAGGCCAACGFDSYVGALQFHHLDPSTKAFEVSRQGITRSLERLRLEAQKCVLLCANCHAMVEAGLLKPPTARTDSG
ncbi:helix-turn-helix domain-containing protein [Solirubrobacter sp. CPCC 204708]|uniref:Helix-turn-helix domain-containing protein n=1 Tax=Solirubrobacter deserti TaxID=2282478 RepID=A0ABT4RPU9_9ACTN|nr:helix-turn-helix domain-containing protein [Solirubrobacter deserti]MBE2316654.1 helix-turn-helix domain-containing protein [Solirubrobacter deserti]MDA0140552.1 helix-turn-helix domain-containing protein [Solirubrobacter deserti]